MVPRMNSLSFTTSHTPNPYLPPPPPALGQSSQSSYPMAHSTSTTSLSNIARPPKSKPHFVWNQNRRFSDFKDLRKLSILGLDDLACLPQLAVCMTACSSTLKALEISLSFDLASRARKPVAPVPTTNHALEVIDDEDEDDMTPPPPQPTVIAHKPTHNNEADVRKEKDAQDSILAKLFALVPSKVEDRKVEKALKDTASRLKSKESQHEAFLEDVKKAMSQLFELKSISYKGLVNDKTILKKLEKSIDKYLNSGAIKANSYLSDSLSSPMGESQNSHNHNLSTNKIQTKPPQVMGSIHHPLHGNFGSKPLSVAEMQDYLVANPSAVGFNPGHHVGNPVYFGTPSPYFSATYPPNSSSPHLVIASSSVGHPNYHALTTASSTIPSHGQYSLNQQPKLQGAPVVSQEYSFQHILPLAQKKDSETLVEFDSGTEEEDSLDMPVGASSATPTPFFAPAAPSKDREDEMDIDMEHPDLPDTEYGTDEEMIEETSTDAVTTETSAVVADPFALVEPQSSAMHLGATPKEPTRSTDPTNHETREHHYDNAREGQVKTTPTKAKLSKPVLKTTTTADEIMNQYLRTTHGFHLEELVVYLVPVKPSVIGRALDLSCLKRLTLLNVGPQVGFWSLVDKLQKESLTMQLESIHTDDVSLAFLNCISNIRGLQELFLMRRSSKEVDSASTKNSASLTDIRILALRRHISTLKRLMIMAVEDDSWDLDSKTFRLLTAKGEGLVELSFSTEVGKYVSLAVPAPSNLSNMAQHYLMQGLHGLKNLHAMHVIALRSVDPTTVAREARKFTVDNLAHLPTLKLKYLAMGATVYELARRSKSLRVRLSYDPKGKGKAKAGQLSTDAEYFNEIENAETEVGCARHLKFFEVPGVKIFTKEVRLGKL